MGNGKSGVVRREKPAFNFEGLSQSEQLAKVKELQQAMQQNGNEAGNPNASPNSRIKDAIKKIDAGMKPLSESIQTTRFISGGALGKMLGLNVDNNNVGKFIETIQNNPEAKQAFTNVLKGTSYTHKAYTSTTYLPEHGTYDTKDIRLNITLKKGTPAIVTNNHAEHEILAGRNAKYDFSKAKWKIIKTKKGKSQLVIDVTI